MRKASMELSFGHRLRSFRWTSHFECNGMCQNVACGAVTRLGEGADHSPTIGLNLSCSPDKGSVNCSAPTTTLPSNGTVAVDLNLSVTSRGNTLPMTRFP